MAKDFNALWSEIKQRREAENAAAERNTQRDSVRTDARRTYSASSVSLPSKTSRSSPRRRKMPDIDHLVSQLVDPRLESEIADAAWYAARKSIYERDPRNFAHNTRLNSWGR